jgi:hypothetical protein
MNKLRPVPFEVLLLICGFAGLVGWGRWYGMTKGMTPSGRKAKQFTFGILLALFLLLAAFNAFENYRLGLPQF